MYQPSNNRSQSSEHKRVAAIKQDGVATPIQHAVGSSGAIRAMCNIGAPYLNSWKSELFGRGDRPEFHQLRRPEGHLSAPRPHSTPLDARRPGAPADARLAPGVRSNPLECIVISCLIKISSKWKSIDDDGPGLVKPETGIMLVGGCRSSASS